MKGVPWAVALGFALGCQPVHVPAATTQPAPTSGVDAGATRGSVDASASVTADAEVDAGLAGAVATAPAVIEKAREISFLSVGDIMFSRGVAAAIVKAKDPKLPYGGFAKTFAAVDFVFGNLETPIGKRKTFAATGGKVFRAPRNVLKTLYGVGFRVLGMANNHAFDAGKKGLLRTLTAVTDAKIQTVGCGKNAKEAWTPAVVEVRGVKIGFVAASYASVNDSGKTWLQEVARIEDKGRLATAIASLKGRAQFVVAVMHAGIEYVAEPFGPQRLFARAAIRAGADVVIGHHPHVVQKVERYQGKLIFNSLGNFIFDKEKRYTDEGAAVKTVLDAKGKLLRHEIVPFVIEKNARPTPVAGERAAGILKRMNVQSTTLK